MTFVIDKRFVMLEIDVHYEHAFGL